MDKSQHCSFQSCLSSFSIHFEIRLEASHTIDHHADHQNGLLSAHSFPRSTACPKQKKWRWRCMPTTSLTRPSTPWSDPPSGLTCPTCSQVTRIHTTFNPHTDLDHRFCRVCRCNSTCSRMFWSQLMMHKHFQFMRDKLQKEVCEHL